MPTQVKHNFDVSWQFSVIMEEPCVLLQAGTLPGIKAAVFHLRVFCHERVLLPPTRHDRYAGCRELTWTIERRMSDLEKLDTSLRSYDTIPPPLQGFRRGVSWQSLFPSEALLREQAGEVLNYVAGALEIVAPGTCDISSYLQPNHKGQAGSAMLRFLGCEECGGAEEVSSGSSLWKPPSTADTREAALVYSMDKGTYIWDHRLEAASADGKPRIRRFDRTATCGDLTATHADASEVNLYKAEVTTNDGSLSLCRQSSLREASCGSGAQAHKSKARAMSLSELDESGIASHSGWHTHKPRGKAMSLCELDESGIASQVPMSPFGRHNPSSPQLSCRSTTASITPMSSPAMSRASSPLRSSGCWETASRYSDDSESYMSLCSDPDTTQRFRPVPIPAVWLEINVDLETDSSKTKKRWWTNTMECRGANTPLGAGRIDLSREDVSKATAGSKASASSSPSRTTLMKYERMAAMYRELSAVHDCLHPIYGYGAEGNLLVVVQAAAASGVGLRALPFTQQRCHNVLGQALQALVVLHEQRLTHGHLCPESFVVRDSRMGPKVQLAWTPGQRRNEGHQAATLGFRAPEPSNPAGDIWSLACVMLVWWAGFSPVAHPWTQFARAQQLEQKINKALEEEPPALPQGLLDMHLAAATAEEPEHSFLLLLASLLTSCLMWNAKERPSAAELLQNSFFKQAL